ncbi:MAG TPA: aminotransferase class V-fold PLP-dependent enzyme [Clostridia bacterium]|nr:aminotransferase class V-fold PLP-dependent enzyme [Clostridia bacterium]
MKNIYFDNAATSFPKPKEVVEQIHYFLTEIGANVQRGLYDLAFSTAQTILETRELLETLFHFPQTENIIFTKNITESLNLIIKGLLKPTDHVLVSALEHNAVLRPLYSLQKKGLQVSQIPYSTANPLDLSWVKKKIRPNTKAIILTQASNVCGTILPLKDISKLCQEKDIFLIIDSAQTAGYLEINFTDLNLDALAFTGHKGLLGPMGIGGLLLRDELAKTLSPLIEGGTGSFSEQLAHPQCLPDKFEAGTLNIPGIYGLNAALKYLLKTKISTIQEKEKNLTQHFLRGIKEITEIEIIGPHDPEKRVPLVSLNFPKRDNAQIATLLAEKYGIMTRCGLHCAPAAHQTLGTYPQGTVRFSFNHFNTCSEIDYALSVLKSLL